MRPLAQWGAGEHGPGVKVLLCEVGLMRRCAILFIASAAALFAVALTGAGAVAAAGPESPAGARLISGDPGGLRVPG
jgi:hypothetical protein